MVDCSNFSVVLIEVVSGLLVVLTGGVDAVVVIGGIDVVDTDV